MTPFAVAEIDPARCKAAGDDSKGIETYPSVEAMIKRSAVDLVTIITPHNTHAPLALKCLRAGKHVVCEKPFAITTAECTRMIDAAEKAGVMVSTYHNRHWDGCVLRAVRELVQNKRIGEIVRVEAAWGDYSMPRDWWRTHKSISGGVLYDWGVHILEYILQVVQGDIVEVAGFAKTGFWASQAPRKTPWIGDANEDEAAAVVRLSTGVPVRLRVTHLESGPKPPMVRFTGTRGTYDMDLGAWSLYTPGRKGITHKTGKSPRSEGQRFYQNIADHLVKGEKLVITPQWARRPIHILDLADRSARQNRTLKAKFA